MSCSTDLCIITVHTVQSLVVNLSFQGIDCFAHSSPIGSIECSECSHDCNMTSHGVECVCPEGMGLDATGKKCIGE